VFAFAPADAGGPPGRLLQQSCTKNLFYGGLYESDQLAQRSTSEAVALNHSVQRRRGLLSPHRRVDATRRLRIVASGHMFKMIWSAIRSERAEIVRNGFTPSAVRTMDPSAT
jgi:hypothetical protein